MAKKAKIIGMGSYLPKKVLSNKDLEKMVETSDAWIIARTGMKERRLAEQGEYTSDMGYEAAKQALKDAKVHPHEVDLILFATITPDYVCPSTACLVQKRLGAKNAAAMDIQAACTGYLYGLSMAKAYVESLHCKTVLVVASEKLSSIVNYQDRNTCVLFGDGASACVVSYERCGYTINNVFLGADGEQAQLLVVPAGGSKQPASFETVQQGLHFLQMEGKEMFKYAIRKMEQAVKHCLHVAGITEKEVSWIVPHQANIRIIESLAKRLKIALDKVFITIHKYGNTSASSVGIALNELRKEKSMKMGAYILLSAFGAGLTWGAATLLYEGEEG